MKRKYMTIVTMLSAISLAACGQTTTTSVSNSTANAQTENSTATDEKPSSDDDASGVNADTDQDRVADKDNNDEEDATSGEETTITVQDGSIKTKGDGVEVDGSTITITEAGTYRFSGTLEDGKIVIDAKKKEVVVIFDDFMITNDEESPVQCLAAKTFTVKIASGSENTVTDGRAAIAEEDTNQSDDTESSSDTDETEEDVPDAAIYSKADLVITGKGSLTVNGGYCDGIHSKDTLIIESGTLKVTATEHGINGKDSLTINGGTFDIESGEDGFHSKGDIEINEGTININAGDDGMHADGNLTVNDGTIDIEKCYEGLEGMTITMNGGDVDIVSEDDGLNAADPDSSSGDEMGFGGGRMGGMAGGGMFEAEEGVSIVINGGTLKINADGDGIDSNGDLTINGGSIIVYGPENSGNSAIDYNGTGVITGGEILTTGMSGRMADTFSEGSTQSYIVYYTTSTEDAGTSIEIVDADGNTIYEDDGTEKKFNMVIYSSDDLKTGNTYTVKVGDSSESVEISDIENTIGTASQDTMGGGMRNHFN